MESVDPITVSVNSWIELVRTRFLPEDAQIWPPSGLGSKVNLLRVQEDDHRTRVNEAVAKAVVCALKGARSADNADDWLNPTEVLR